MFDLFEQALKIMVDLQENLLGTKFLFCDVKDKNSVPTILLKMDF